MTAQQLAEIKKKFEEKNGDINDVGLLLCDFFQSMSNHLKDIKSSNKELVNNIECIFDEINDIKDALNPVYTIVHADED